MAIYASYGKWKYSAAVLRLRVEAVVARVRELRSKENGHFDVVVLSGTSGTWLGAALQMHPQWPSGLPIVLVRKSSESSHGSTVEGRVETALLVDDFVCSGETVRRVDEALQTYAGIHLMGVLSHCYLGDDPAAPLYVKAEVTAYSAGWTAKTIPTYAAVGASCD